jgi:hypothetical protein
MQGDTNDYSNHGPSGTPTPASRKNERNRTVEQAGFASVQAPAWPASPDRGSDLSAAQENLVPDAATGFERGSLAHLEAPAQVLEIAETPTIADVSLAAATLGEQLALADAAEAEEATDAAAPAFPAAATTASVDARAAKPPSTTSPAFPATRPDRPSPWSNVYGGLHGSLQWTGLLSQNNAQPDENLDPMLNIGYAFGLHAGYRFNPRIALETGLVLNSRQGSRYESSVDTRNEEIPVTKSLMLHYTQVPLTLRISPGRHPQGGMPEGWSYVGGLQYGMLRTSKLRIEDRRVNPERNLQEHDVAVLLGMDYDLPLNDQLFVTLGFRGSLGLNQANVTTVEGINSDKRNAVLGFRAAFNGFLLPQ